MVCVNGKNLSDGNGGRKPLAELNFQSFSLRPFLYKRLQGAVMSYELYKNIQINEKSRFVAGDHFCGIPLWLASEEMKLELMRNMN